MLWIRFRVTIQEKDGVAGVVFREWTKAFKAVLKDEEMDERRLMIRLHSGGGWET